MKTKLKIVTSKPSEHTVFNWGGGDFNCNQAKKIQHKPLRGNSHFGPQGGHGGLDEGLPVVRIKGEGLANPVQLLERDGRRLVVPVGDANGVDPAVQEKLRLLQESPGQHCV